MQVHFFIVQPFMTPVQGFSQNKNFRELHRRALGGAMFSGELARATGSCLHDDPPELALRHRCSKCRLQPTSAILKKTFLLWNQLLLLTSLLESKDNIPNYVDNQ